MQSKHTLQCYARIDALENFSTELIVGGNNMIIITKTKISFMPCHWLNSLTVQFSSVQSLDRLGYWGEDLRDDSAEILFQSFLQEALVSSSGIGRDVHYSMLSIQHFPCRPQRCPPSEVLSHCFTTKNQPTNNHHLQHCIDRKINRNPSCDCHSGAETEVMHGHRKTHK